MGSLSSEKVLARIVNLQPEIFLKKKATTHDSINIKAPSFDPLIHIANILLQYEYFFRWSNFNWCLVWTRDRQCITITKLIGFTYC